MPGKGAVLLMHGVRGSRLEEIDRARFLARSGFSVLLFDFRACGESTGDTITFGYKEALDARAAFDALKQRASGERIGVVATSLGGAAAILADPPLEADAFVLEAVYGSFDRAVGNRIAERLGGIGRVLLTSLLTWQVKPRLGFDPSVLAPARQISRLRGDILLIGGENDAYAPLTEQQELLANAHEPKSLWIVPKAGHVDFHRFARDDYEARVGSFLALRLSR